MKKRQVNFVGIKVQVGNCHNDCNHEIQNALLPFSPRLFRRIIHISGNHFRGNQYQIDDRLRTQRDKQKRGNRKYYYKNKTGTSRLSCGQLAIVCKRSPSVLRQTVTEYCREHNRSRKRDQKSDCCKDRFISPHQIRYHNETSFLLQYYIQIIFLIDLITAQSIPNAFLAR